VFFFHLRCKDCIAPSNGIKGRQKSFLPFVFINGASNLNSEIIHNLRNYVFNLFITAFKFKQPDKTDKKTNNIDMKINLIALLNIPSPERKLKVTVVTNKMIEICFNTIVKRSCPRNGYFF
jgi:hypothetical protein